MFERNHLGEKWLHKSGQFAHPHVMEWKKILIFLQNKLPKSSRTCWIYYLPKEVIQQDSCLAHYAQNIRNYFDEKYPGRSIGCKNSIMWPLLSPLTEPVDDIGFRNFSRFQIRPQTVVLTSIINYFLSAHPRLNVFEVCI